MIRNRTRLVIAECGVALLLAAQASGQDAAILKDERAIQMYAVGVDLARNLKRQGFAATEADAVAQGVRDELAGAKLFVTEPELQAALNAFQTELKQTRGRALRYVAQDNKLKGDAFLAKNRAKEGVMSLPSGLQYKIVKEGSGAKPEDGDTVRYNYRSTRIDGTELDNSYRLGKPGTLALKTAIPGLKEALKLMPAGSTWQLFIPPELAYGEKGFTSSKRGTGRSIGPYETLIYEVELVGIN